MSDISNFMKMQNHYLFGEHPVDEVTPFDGWDYVEVANDPRVNAPRKFFDPDNESEVLNSKIRLVEYQHEWSPFSEAIEELKALVASWRARGWNDAADFLEGRPVYDYSDGDVIYDGLGENTRKRITLEFPLSECKFYKYDYSKASNGIRMLTDPNVPTGSLFGFTGIRVSPPDADMKVEGNTFSDAWTCNNHLTPVPDIPTGESCPVCGGVE